MTAQRWRHLGTAALSALVLATPAGCDSDADAHAELSFRFEATLDPGSLWFVSTRLLEVASQSVLREPPPVFWEAGTAFSTHFDALPLDVELAIVVELRPSEDLEQRVRYYGRSAPFVLRSGATTPLEVSIPIRAPLAEDNNTLSVRVAPEDAYAGLVDRDALRAVAVDFSSLRATRVQLSTRSDLADPLEIDLASPAPHATCVGCERGTCCTIAEFDLLAADGGPIRSVHNLFAVFFDVAGYPSAPVVARVQVDVEAPVVLAAAVSPHTLRLGQSGQITLTASERVEAPSLQVDALPDGLTVSAPFTPNGGTVWVWPVAVAAGSVEVLQALGAPETSTTGLEIAQLSDGRGNTLPGPLRLEDDPFAAAPTPLTLRIDRYAPRITPVGLSVRVGELELVATPGSEPFPTPRAAEVTVEVEVQDATLTSWSVSFAGVERPCDATPSDAGVILSCRFDPQQPRTSRPDEGPRPIVVSAADAAGNQHVTAPFVLSMDYSPPAIVGVPTVFVGTGRVFSGYVAITDVDPAESLEYLFVLNEPLAFPARVTYGDRTLLLKSDENPPQFLAPLELDGLEPGVYDVNVTATDRALNTVVLSLGQFILPERPPP